MKSYPRLSLSWYSQATPGQGVVGEEQVNSSLPRYFRSLLSKVFNSPLLPHHANQARQVRTVKTQNRNHFAFPQFAEEGGEEADDGYTPPQEDYLPPGLQVSALSCQNFPHLPLFQEHEDILSQASQDDGAEELNDTNDGPEELNEDLLDDEEEEDDEKSWKRRNNEDD